MATYDLETEISVPSTATSTPVHVPRESQDHHAMASDIPGGKHFPDDGFEHVSSDAPVIDMNSVVDESGMTFQAYREGKYFFPNDPKEQDRLDLQHTCFTILLEGKLLLAPMPKKPECVLDVATGTGIWAIQYAEDNPNAQVIGTDLSAIQPASGPPNCSFVQGDCEEPWVFPQVAGFDYVHIRFVYSCFDNPRLVIQHAYESIRPGGWIEFHDTEPRVLSVDGSHEGTAVQKYFKLIHQGASIKGREFMVAEHYKDWLVEAGFTEVVEKKIIWPCNAWPKDARRRLAGRYMAQNLLVGARAVGWKALRAAGLSVQETEDLVADVQKHAMDQRIRAYMPAHIVYGRKPFEGEHVVRTPPTCESEDITTEIG